MNANGEITVRLDENTATLVQDGVEFVYDFIGMPQRSRFLDFLPLFNALGLGRFEPAR